MTRIFLHPTLNVDVESTYKYVKLQNKNPYSYLLPAPAPDTAAARATLHLKTQQTSAKKGLFDL